MRLLAQAISPTVSHPVLLSQGDKVNEDGNDNYPPPPSLRSSSALSQGDSQYGVYSFPVVTVSTPETGVVPRRGGGGGWFHLSVSFVPAAPAVAGLARATNSADFICFL